MSQTPFESAGSLRVGSVVFVSPDEIRVVLDIDAPESVALNTGLPRTFPRVNGYLLVPVDDSYLVGQIEWITVERTSHSSKEFSYDRTLIDLPQPLRRMRLNPLGTLRTVDAKGSYRFQRGADSLPSIGTVVQLPTDNQLRSIVESGEGRRVKIGTSPLAGNAEVCIDPDRLFGRHLAVLGNTGSGKSCSVAGLIRWSLEQAGNTPNARFIVLDPNGEYARAFTAESSSIRARVFKVDPDKEAGELPLQVPLWFWNSSEWCCFSQASAKTQRPVLIQALRFLKEGELEPTHELGHETRRFLRTLLSIFRIERNSSAPWGTYPKPKAFFERLEKVLPYLSKIQSTCTGTEFSVLHELTSHIDSLCVPLRGTNWNRDSMFFPADIDALIQLTSTAHANFGGSENDPYPSDADAPIRFTGTSLIRCLEATAEMLNVPEHIETLLIRVRSLLADSRMKSIISDIEELTLEKWLSTYIGEDGNESGCISILDLSLVPTEIVHVITAVIARITFESLQRYRKSTKTVLPTVLVMEEAHTFIRRYKDDVDNQDAAAVCCKVFERIAREGRKFGLGLVLSSQRPSELSPTVLSQCNSFLLHRISNDSDQDLVNRLVPDNLRGLLRELPSLPPQHAILLGWASELPVLTKMNDLPKDQQPHSDDPDFWDVWTRTEARKSDWALIAHDWQQKQKLDSTVNTSDSPPEADLNGSELSDDIPF